jgi:hypothetical protein
MPQFMPPSGQPLQPDSKDPQSSQSVQLPPSNSVQQWQQPIPHQQLQSPAGTPYPQWQQLPQVPLQYIPQQQWQQAPAQPSNPLQYQPAVKYCPVCKAQNWDYAQVCYRCNFPAQTQTRRTPINQQKRRLTMASFVLLIGAFTLIASIFFPVVRITPYTCGIIFCNYGEAQEISEFELLPAYVQSKVPSDGNQGYITSQPMIMSQPMQEVAQIFVPDLFSTFSTFFLIVLFIGAKSRSSPPLTQANPQPPKLKKPFWTYIGSILGVIVKIASLVHDYAQITNPPPNITWQSGYIGSGNVVGIVAVVILGIGFLMDRAERRQGQQP